MAPVSAAVTTVIVIVSSSSSSNIATVWALIRSKRRRTPGAIVVPCATGGDRVRGRSHSAGGGDVSRGTPRSRNVRAPVPTSSMTLVRPSTSHGGKLCLKGYPHTSANASSAVFRQTFHIRTDISRPSCAILHPEIGSHEKRK